MFRLYVRRGYYDRCPGSKSSSCNHVSTFAEGESFKFQNDVSRVINLIQVKPIFIASFECQGFEIA